jgi:two-component system chemotaxis sensor kinase CheA
MEDLLPDFLMETTESLAELDLALVKLENNPDDKQTLGSVFRHVHTIKGTCGFLGLSRLESVAHAAENVLGKYRDGAIAVTPGSITLILRALDAIKEILGALQASGQEPEGNDAVVIADLTAAAEGRLAEVGGGEAPADVADEAPAPVAESPVEIAPVAEALAPEAPVAEVPAVVTRSTAAEAPLRSAPSAASKGNEMAKPPEPAAQTIRVSVDVLEGLMTLVSELVLTRNQILQLARAEANEAFAVPLQRLSHITSDLQEGVMKTRMQPIGHAWNNLPRLVRDLALELGKKIELIMVGADTELDRQVLELIKDPLTHMVRNSGDHGLESPADRRAAGKPETGHITLNAYHEGGHILVEIKDDGRGLPVERIRSKILANSLATESELAGMTDQQIQSFIFRAGFSTAAAITAVSGRGVGMDVVKTNIERIGGTIDLSSEAGVGTTFSIKIPLTLAIVSALIVEVSGERFAIPQISVVELVRAQQSSGSGGAEHDRDSQTMIEHINDTPVLRLRDQLLPLVELSALLRLQSGEVAQSMMEKRAADGGSLYIVVAQVGSNRCGLIVDRVFDTEEIVVKPVAPILRHITMFSGNTILGDGSVIMILDPNGIARATGIGPGGGADPVVSIGSSTGERSGEKMALLLFRAGNDEPKAVPLSLISRLENIDRKLIEHSTGTPLTQYRGKLMPLISLDGSGQSTEAAKSDHQAVLVFADGNRVMGLMVDQIVDVVEDYLRVELSTETPGFLGTAIIRDEATDVLDTGFWLKRAFKDWFGAAAGGPPRRRSILVVEDSSFFRSLIIPALSSANYDVTAVENPVLALGLRDAGKTFDVILSDIEMPEMDGFAFAKAVRAAGAWTDLPMVALTSRDYEGAVEQGRQAGFNDYISKFDKTTLLDAVQRMLAPGFSANAKSSSAHAESLNS